MLYFTIRCAVMLLAWSVFPHTAAAYSDSLATETLSNEERLALLEENADHLWTITAALIVFLMQGGYLLYEAGLVRSKNSINVAQKNLADAFISATFYYLIGFNIMYGHSLYGVIGWGTDHYSLTNLSSEMHTFFVYQIVFCGTVATIVSGALAERMRFGAYLACTAFISTVIYPIFGHWAWGNKLDPTNHTFLTDDGFIDFAGSTVVSATGGWVALAGLLVIGPRLGKYNEHGKVMPIHGHSIVLAVMGGLILWLGAMAFNSGLAHAGSEELAHVISNTVLAGSFGGLTCLIIGRLHEGIYRPQRSLYGMLGGVVAVAAGCHIFPTISTLIVSITAGFVCYFGFEYLTHKLKIDDAVCAIPINGLCGAMGTIMVGPLMLSERLPEGATHWSQTLVQMEGVLVSFLWAFCVSYLFFKLVDYYFGLRVTPEEEIIGLNTAEHGTTLGTGLLQEALYDIVEGEHDLTRRLDQTTGDESAEIAYMFNKFIERMQFLMISITQNAKVLNTSSERLSRMSGVFSESFEDIFKESEELGGTTNTISSQVDNVAGIARTINQDVAEIARNAGDMSRNLHDVSDMVSNMTHSMQDIASNAGGVSEVTSTAQQQAAQANRSMNQLIQSTERIDGVVDLIKDIAEQTNLLALNAVIESARAGEAGKGFSVVANQVKSLAQQTAQATEDITTRINDMVKNTNDVRQVISDVTDIISMIDTSITSISESVSHHNQDTKTMSGKLDQSTDGVQAVAESIESVSNGIQTVSSSMQDAAKALNDVLSSVQHFTEETKANQNAAHNVSETSKDLASIADQLVDTVTQYKI